MTEIIKSNIDSYNTHLSSNNINDDNDINDNNINYNRFHNYHNPDHSNYIYSYNSQSIDKNYVNDKFKADSNSLIQNKNYKNEYTRPTDSIDAFKACIYNDKNKNNSNYRKSNTQANTIASVKFITRKLKTTKIIDEKKREKNLLSSKIYRQRKKKKFNIISSYNKLLKLIVIETYKNGRFDNKIESNPLLKDLIKTIYYKKPDKNNYYTKYNTLSQKEIDKYKLILNTSNAQSDGNTSANNNSNININSINNDNNYGNINGDNKNKYNDSYLKDSCKKDSNLGNSNTNSISITDSINNQSNSKNYADSNKFDIISIYSINSNNNNISTPLLSNNFISLLNNTNNQDYYIFLKNRDLYEI